MKVRSVIIDDEPVARRLLREYIDDIPFLDIVGEADNPLKAQVILDREPVDLIFLDINMPRLTGIEFLRSGNSLPMVIMTTAYAEHALDGFTLDVLDYLVKPFSFDRFLKACNKAKEYQWMQKRAQANAGADENYFFVKCNGRIEKVLYDDLFYVEAALNYVVLHTRHNKMFVYLTIKGIIEDLPSTLFIKVHKSFIVNRQKITSIEGNIIRLANVEIPISQNYHEEVMKIVLGGKLLKR